MVSVKPQTNICDASNSVQMALGCPLSDLCPNLDNMQVFHASKAIAESSSSQDLNIVETFRQAGIREQMPFILRDDGSLDQAVNMFLRRLPVTGVQSPRSWREYARDVVTWGNWLESVRGKTIWDANFDDVVAFHSARTDGDGAKPIMSSTWNRGVASCCKLYDFGIAEGLLTNNPFRRASSLSQPIGGRHNQRVSRDTATDRLPRRRLRYLTLEQFRQFRDVGLRGRLLNGREHPSWRGTEGSRNALFAEVCVSTGMRLVEAASLLEEELPTYHQDQQSLPLDCAAGTSKNGNTRRVWIPAAVRQRIQQYIALERRIAIDVGSERGLYAHPHWLRGELVAPGVVSLPNGRTPISRLRPESRAALLLKDSNGRFTPACLWLTSVGTPVSRSAWRSVFHRASERCATAGLDLHASPHSLRHTYAIYTLRNLVRMQLGDLGGISVKNPSAYRRLAFDPLRQLQILMGHASVETTMIYLDVLPEVEGVFSSASDLLGDGLFDGAHA